MRPTERPALRVALACRARQSLIVPNQWESRKVRRRLAKGSMGLTRITQHTEATGCLSLTAFEVRRTRVIRTEFAIGRVNLYLSIGLHSSMTRAAK